MTERNNQSHLCILTPHPYDICSITVYVCVTNQNQHSYEVKPTSSDHFLSAQDKQTMPKSVCLWDNVSLCVSKTAAGPEGLSDESWTQAASSELDVLLRKQAVSI